MNPPFLKAVNVIILPIQNILPSLGGVKSQEYVATQIGLHRTAITAIELGQRSVSTEELKKFSELYGLSLDELVYGEDLNSEVKVFTRRYSELSEDDQREIINLIEFKLRLKKTGATIAE